MPKCRHTEIEPILIQFRYCSLESVNCLTGTMAAAAQKPFASPISRANIIAKANWANKKAE